MTRDRRLNPEDSMQITFKETLDLLKPRCIYLHIPNEGKRSWAQGKRMKRMGLKAGAPDWIFVWPAGVYKAQGWPKRWVEVGFIEMKSKTGILSPSQTEFMEECSAYGIPYSVSRSVEHALDILRSWGIKFEREMK